VWWWWYGTVMLLWCLLMRLPRLRPWRRLDGNGCNLGASVRCLVILLLWYWVLVAVVMMELMLLQQVHLLGADEMALKALPRRRLLLRYGTMS
jgi:hypothetical protein